MKAIRRTQSLSDLARFIYRKRLTSEGGFVTIAML